jgi:hypothetical protein
MKSNILSKIKKFLSSKKLKKGILLGGILSFAIVLKAKAIGIVGGIAWGLVALSTYIFAKDIFEGIGLAAAWAIAGIVQIVAGGILIVELKILTWVTSINTFSSLPIVQHGWRIARDFSYMLFIIVLLVIAIGTILGLKEYEAKNTLWKVIVMAILINFSLMIGGAIIDFTQVVFNFLLMAPLEQKTNLELTNVLAKQLQLHKIFEPDKEQTEVDKKSKEQEALDIFSKYLIVILFSFVMVIVFGALIAILVARALYLWILLIVSPLAWMLWALPLPQLKEHSTKWWSTFIAQAFKAPIVAFFIFLAISMSLNLDSTTPPESTRMNDSGIRVVADNQASDTTSEVKSSNYLLIDEFFKKSEDIDHKEHMFSNEKKGVFNTTSLLTSLITAAILFAALLVNPGKIAGKAVGMVKGWGSKAFAKGRQWGKQAAKKGGKGAMNWGAPRLQRGFSKAGSFMEEKAPWARGIGSFLSKTPLGIPFRAATKATRGYVAKNQAELFEKEQKNMDVLSTEEIKRKWKAGGLRDMEKMAAASVLASRKSLSQEGFNEASNLMGKYRLNKQKEEIGMTNPQFGSSFGSLALNTAQAQRLIGKQNFNLGTKEGTDNIKQRIEGVKDESEIKKILSEIIAINYGGNAELAKSDGWSKDKLKKMTGKDIDLDSAEMKTNIDKINIDIKAGRLPERIKKKMGEMFKDIDFGKMSIDFDKDVMFQEGSAGYNLMANVASNLDGDNLVKLLGNFKDPDKAKNFLLTSIRHAKGKTDEEKVNHVNSLWNSRGQLNGSMGANIGGYTMSDLASETPGFSAGAVDSKSVETGRYSKLEDKLAEFERKQIEKEKDVMRKKAEGIKRILERAGKTEELSVIREVDEVGGEVGGRKDIEEIARRRAEKITEKEERRLIKEEERVEEIIKKKEEKDKQWAIKEERRIEEIERKEKERQKKERRKYE